MSQLQAIAGEPIETVDTDSIVNSWLFMGSPVPMLTILGVYLYFVLKLGPQLMKNRAPFELKYIIIIYNALQVIYSSWLVSLAFQTDQNIMLLFTQCNALPPRSSYAHDLLNGAWFYFFAKIVELLDTVFFVLRKKQSQVTFLHVYHHAIMVASVWVYTKYMPGEQGAVVGLINTAVHVVMYSYYLIAALGPQYQKYLWWKKYLTWVQLIQFCLVLAYVVFTTLNNCKVSKAVTIFFAPQAVIFLYLFLDYYKKEYTARKGGITGNEIQNKLN